MPVTNVPQQAGLEGVGVGHNPAPLLFPNNGVPLARGDGDAGVAAPARGDGAAVEVLLARGDGDAGTIPAGEDGAVGVLLAREDGAVGELLAMEDGDAEVPPVMEDGDAVEAPPARGHAAVGVPPARGDGDAGAPPVKSIVPQEKVEQIARETVALAVELLQKQKETVRNIALALNEIILLSHEFANSSIDLRLSDLRHLNNLSPPAADDEDDIVPKNVWVSGTIGITKYNGKCLLSSYTGRTSAATIGGDLELPNGSIIGGAYNYVLSNFEYKNSTEKFTAHTHVIFMYGQTNLSKKLILQGFLSLASGNVSAKLPVQNQLDKAKFANSSYSSKLVVAYKSKVGKALIIPHIGLKYGGQDIAGYGASFERQSLSVAATNSRRSSGLIGFEVIMPMKISDTTQVIPGLHMEVEKFLHNKQQKLHMQVMSGPSSKEEILLLEKPAKYNYKIGGTITIKRGLTEIMAVYNYLASNNKYSSHQGSLKLKLSF
ncbi:autotransporter outer membrane beta-barrel domain-containing protein [Candidatus Tisiphia endosymbiont of Piscicola geometra]|uniref:autotransporter outer membrane beta-barrel domain-containing protein n=1 Tax=Candidatus Tisiphia endosymbiont of Piscicola geometra TaxID=3066273 RepID=UPI00312C7C1B